MARGAWISLVLLCLLAAPLAADFQQEERDRERRQADEAVWETVFGRRVVREAYRQLGRPYVWGGKTEAGGFDCSGYTAWVFHSLGVDLAPSALGQYQQGVEVTRQGLAPGDLVFFLGRGSPLHVGIYVGDGRFLHAPGTGKVIELSSISSAYFAPRFTGGRRLTPSLDDERRRRAAQAAPASSPGSPPNKENP